MIRAGHTEIWKQSFPKRPWQSREHLVNALLCSAALAKYHKLRGLNSRHLFLTVQQQEGRDWTSAWSGSGDGLLSGLWTYTVLRSGGWGEHRHHLSVSLLLRTLIPFPRALPT